jgi:hypothetical protein
MSVSWDVLKENQGFIEKYPKIFAVNEISRKVLVGHFPKFPLLGGDLMIPKIATDPKDY